MVTKSQLQAELKRIAPLELAGEWDNVGMLIHPSQKDSEITGVCLTIDLTESVLREALKQHANFIIAYHPILFGGVKRLSATRHAERVVIECIQNDISVYSPHTALDAVDDGVTDWLLEQVGPMSASSIIDPNPSVMNAGMGRIGTLKTPTALNDVITTLKERLGLSYLRVAVGSNQSINDIKIHRVAVCPGAGGSVVGLSKDHDCIVTGEMRHHDVLYAQSIGVTTILTEHTNCERGFLPVLERRLRAQLPSLKTFVAASDQDPLQTY
jgi:dinuclear metal center YbgI/SA1388 family protein